MRFDNREGYLYVILEGGESQIAEVKGTHSNRPDFSIVVRDQYGLIYREHLLYAKNSKPSVRP